MGILDDYMNGVKATEPAPVPTGSSLINDYMATPSVTGRPRVEIVAPPISGVSAEESARINADYAANPKASTPNNTRDFPSVGNAILEDVIAGINQIGKGFSEITQNKPATGVGTIGMGGLQTVGSLLSGPGKVLASVTGNKDFADKAELVVGSALPVVPLARAVSAAKPTNKAMSMLVEHIGEGDLPRVVREMKADPSLSPADLSPRVRMSTQRLLANVEGPHANYIENAANARKATAADDLQRQMDANLGTVVNPVEKLAELKQNIKAVGDKEIGPAVAGSKPVDLSKTIAHIDDILNPGVSSKISADTVIADPALEASLRGIRKFLTDDQSVRIDPEQLNRLQSAFRKKAEMLKGKDPYTANAISQVRENIVDAIDKASGGKYRPALAKYRDEYHVEDAFNYGHDTITKNGKSLSDRPEFFEDWIKTADKAELEAAREGARIAYDTQMNGFKHAARRGTDIGDVEFNRRRMEALFGKEETEKMSKAFENAKMRADTNNKLTQGSQSRVQQAAGTEFEPYNPDKAKSGPLANAVNVGIPLAAEMGTMALGAPSGLGAAAGAGGLIGLKVAGKAYSAAKTATIRKLENERNMQYAKYALPVDAPSRDALIQELDAIANRSSKLSTRNKLRMLISP